MALRQMHNDGTISLENTKLIVLSAIAESQFENQEFLGKPLFDKFSKSVYF